MSKVNNAVVKTPSVLGFERKIDPSDALFFSCSWDNREDESACEPVRIVEKSIRGTISNRVKGGDDPAKLDKQIQNANLQRVDVAMVPDYHDTLKVQFTVRVLKDLGIANACNQREYQQKLSDIVKEYVEQDGFRTVSLRYAENLANARFLWRNRLVSEEIDVRVSRIDHGEAANTVVFSPEEENLSLAKFTDGHAGIESVAKEIQNGLLGIQHTFLRVTAFARVGSGQEVFPSQELLLDKAKNSKGKTLYSVRGIAAMHSQKIGNAIRTIDTWYPLVDDFGPIPVEVYGSITNQGIALRQPKGKMDFYTLMDNWMLKDTIEESQKHYVIAMLIRGGVFGKSEKEDKKNDNTE